MHVTCEKAEKIKEEKDLEILETEKQIIMEPIQVRMSLQNHVAQEENVTQSEHSDVINRVHRELLFFCQAVGMLRDLAANLIHGISQIVIRSTYHECIPLQRQSGSIVLVVHSLQASCKSRQ